MKKKKNNEKEDRRNLIIKILIIIIIILLLIHSCVLFKKNNRNTIDINCKDHNCNSILRSLTLSPNNIEFKEDVYNYNIEVDSNVDEVIINALPFDPSTKVDIPSDLSLKDGLNTFKIEVTTKDGIKKTYTINVNKKASDNKILKDINVSPVNIDFNEEVYNYDIDVASSVDKISIDVLPFDDNTKVDMPSDLNLKVGKNTFKVEVTTKDGVKKVYTINVNRKSKAVVNPILKDLTVSPKDINFKENTYTYNIEVDSNVSEVVINAMPYSNSTKVVIPNDLSLKDGKNTFKVEVITKDGVKKVYTINVTKKPSNVVKDIVVSPKDIDFNEDKDSYDISVSSDVDKISIDVSTFDKDTKVVIPNDLSLKDGKNTFKIEVTTKDGIKKVYTINVTKKSSNVVKDIVVSPKDIDFNEDKDSYDISVSSDVDKISIDVSTFDKDTKVVIPNDLSLKGGLNTFKVEVTTKDGVKKVYTINVTREVETKIVKDIVVSPKDIDFSEDTYTYDINVENSVDKISIDVSTFDKNTKVVIPKDLSLNEGENTFKVEVTTKDGVKKVYTINVTREEPTGELFVSDGRIRWSETTSANIFENPNGRGNIIEPESSNTYEFNVKNSTNSKLKYKIEFVETNPYNINMKYKLKKNGTYIVDNYVSVFELNATNVIIDVGNNDKYDLEWKWVSSDNDTEVGKVGNANYELKIEIEAESING